MYSAITYLVTYLWGITMKTLNITFEDKEYKRLAKAKNGKNLSWHDFILTLLDKEENSGGRK